MRKTSFVLLIAILTVSLLTARTIPLPEHSNPVVLMTTLCLADKVIPLVNLSRPEAVEVNNDNAYIVDGVHVYIYSLTDFKLKKKFGRMGEGPQEFKNWIILYVQPDHLFINSPNKISYFNLEGKFIKEIKSKYIWGRFKPLDESFVGHSYVFEGATRYEGVYIFDADFSKVKELSRKKHFFQKEQYINRIEERPPFFYIVGEKIFVDDPKGIIHVFDKDGNELYTIDAKLEPLKFTAADKDRYVKWFTRTPQRKQTYERRKNFFRFPKYFPPIRMFHVVDNKIYILTFKEKDNKNECVIWASDGTFIKRAWLPVGPFEESIIPLFYTIKNDKLYRIVENEEDQQWELHISAI